MTSHSWARSSGTLISLGQRHQPLDKNVLSLKYFTYLQRTNTDDFNIASAIEIAKSHTYPAAWLAELAKVRIYLFESGEVPKL